MKLKMYAGDVLSIYIMTYNTRSWHAPTTQTN